MHVCIYVSMYEFVCMYEWINLRVHVFVLQTFFGSVRDPRELLVELWQEIGCEQGIRRDKKLDGSSELGGTRNWVWTNY